MNKCIRKAIATPPTLLGFDLSPLEGSSAAGISGRVGKCGGEIVPSLGNMGQESVLFTVPGKLSRILGTFLPWLCIRHVTLHSIPLGDSDLASQPSGSLPGGVTWPPRPEKNTIRTLTANSPARVGEGGISWSRTFSYTGEVSRTLKKLWFCDAITGNKGRNFFFFFK